MLGPSPQLQGCLRGHHRGPTPRPLAVARRAIEQSSPEGVSAEENGNGGARASVDERRIAAAAKVSAARALARRLANEQAIAIASAKSAAGDSLDEEEIELIRQSVGASSAQAAKEAAVAGAKERKARRSRSLSAAQLAELARMKEENDALQSLVLDLAADKDAAKAKISRLREQYNDLVQELPDSSPAKNNGAAPSDQTAVQSSSGSSESDNTASSTKDEELDQSQDLPPATKPRKESLQDLARSARKNGRNLFYSPPEGIPIATGGRFFYNRASSPLQGDGPLQLKAGINKWQSIEVYDMQRSEELRDIVDTNWWFVDLQFDDDIFKIDFVVTDVSTSIVDNNRGQDFRAPLVGALTEAEILERNAVLLAELEDARMKMLEDEEERIWQQQREQAYGLADDARAKFRQQFEDILWQEAIVAATRQRENLGGHAKATQQEWKGRLLWRTPPQAGKRAVLLYNKDSGSTRHGQGVIAHVGFDAWYENSTGQVALSKVSSQERSLMTLPDHGDWWQGSIEIPSSVQQLDLVLSDSNKKAWDNNSNKDYHVAVVDALTKEKLVETIFEDIWNTRQNELKEGEDNAAKRTIRNMEEKAKASRKRRDLQRHIYYSDPPTPEAGTEMSLYYNPDTTALRGRPEIWVRGSFNRGAHAQRFGPFRMEALVRGGNGFHKTNLKIPEDAWMIDFSVSDAEAGGSFRDDNGGMEYHIDVIGSSTKAAPLTVVHVAVEMAPIAKVGGMADVVTALGRAVKEAGHNCVVIVPKYDVLRYAEIKHLHLEKEFGFGGTQIKVWRGEVEELDTVFLEPCNGTVWAGCIYGRNDDAARFAFFCSAVADYLKHHYPGSKPDIVHTHDWQSAPVCFSDVHPAKSIFTIHNMEFRVDMIGRAVGSSAISTTVSPTYATEVSGHPAIAPHLSKFYGIRNGIDQEIWDPLFDKYLPKHYNHENTAEGKAAAKAELRRRMDLSSADVPLVSVVTRLTHQKGIHLIKHAAWRTLERGGQFVLLGSAPDPRVQTEFNQLAGEIARQYPDRGRFWFAYDEPLSHLIYAGSDMFLVPSMFEPCGLTQMIAMRYGTIPVVRKTGGLNDTVFDVDDDVERAHNAGMEPNGFSFVGADAAGLDYALNRALEVWYTDKGLWQTLTMRVMQQDWSWAEPAFDYVEIYYKALRS